MLCRHCHVHTVRGFPVCLHCGVLLRGGVGALQPSQLHSIGSLANFSLQDRCVTIGRGSGNTIRLRDEYASRYHARIWRDPDCYRLEDLDSLNGTAVNGQVVDPGGSVQLRDLDTITLGRTDLQIEQPRSDAVGWRTVVGPVDDGVSAGSGDRDGADDMGRITLLTRPRRKPGWAMKRVASNSGREQYVLRGSNSHAYIRLTQRDVFLWNLMDGDHTVHDLLLAYSNEYGQLALPRIEQLLRQLAQSELIAGPPGPVQSTGPLAQFRRTAFFALTRLELVIPHLDGVFDLMYRRGGWLFFTPVGSAIVLLSALGGLVAFGFSLQHQRVLQFGGAGLVGVTVVLGAYFVAVVLHECAHAVTVKSYGRRVPRAGIMIRMGVPYAFVDTTDIWFEPPDARIMVSVAGPIATLSIASLFSAVALFGPGIVVPALCFQVAFGLYLNTLFNCNPLIPLDGYYALSDLVDTPQLREQASAYFRSGLWSDIRRRKPLSRRQLGLAVFALTSVVSTAIFIVLGVYVWNNRISGLTKAYIPRPLNALVVAAGLTLLFFPVLYGPYVRARTRFRRMHESRRRAPLAQAGAEE